jgi:hypothetical protein
MIRRILAASITTLVLLLPSVGCNQKEKAVLPTSMIPLPPHGPTAGGVIVPSGEEMSKPKPPEAGKDKDAPKKDADPAKGTPPK